MLLLMFSVYTLFAQEIQTFNVEGEIYTVKTHKVTFHFEMVDDTYDISFLEIIFPDSNRHFFISQIWDGHMFFYTGKVIDAKLKDINFDGQNEVCISLSELTIGSLFASGASSYINCNIYLKPFEQTTEKVFMTYDKFYSESSTAKCSFLFGEKFIIQKNIVTDSSSKKITNHSEVYEFENDGRLKKPQSPYAFPTEKIEYLIPIKADIELWTSYDGRRKKVIEQLSPSSKTYLVRRDPNKIIIDGVEGYWCQVISDKKNIGWVFDGYCKSE
jgi:hypothetical protein